MSRSMGNRLRQYLANGNTMPFIGVYDTFSASIAAKHYDGIFISGFGFAASHYGLPDIGFIAWSDIVAFVRRVRTILPDHHILVDIDDGYADTDVACHVVSLLESAGVTGVVLEDQQRPRRCGHFNGKRIMELDGYVEKLRKVLETRKDIFVVARTDASGFDERARRITAFAEAGADAVLADGIEDLESVRKLSQCVDVPLAFNQIAGGKSPACNLDELKEAGVSLVIYSTPCLFAAQLAIDDALKGLKKSNGRLQPSKNWIGVRDCTAVLQDNLERRDEKWTVFTNEKQVAN